MTRILITGGAGFVGRHLAEYYQNRAEVRVLDNLRSSKAANLQNLNVEFIRGDVRDRIKVARAMEGVDFIFHFAGMNSVQESMEKPMECVDINVNGTLTVLEEAAKAGVKRLCYGSSAAVYGDNPLSPKQEDMLPVPKSPYAVTKLDGEHYCNIFTRMGKLSTASLRYFNVFGPGQDPQCEYAAAIAQFVNQAIRGENLVIYGDGEQSRDFVYIDDAVKATAFVMEYELEGIYNIASGNAMTINELVNRIRFAVDSQSEVEYRPVRPGDIRHLLASVEKLNAAGFRCETPFGKSLTETIGALS